MNYKTLTGLQNLFKSVVRPKSSGDFFAWLGNAQGTVVADDNNGVYIMDWNGNVRVVMNNKVPPYPFRPVRVGYVSEASKVLEVKEFVDAYPTHRPPHVPNHAGNHEWGGVDTMFVRSEQILPGVAIPDDDDPLVLHVAGFVYYLNGWHIIDSFTLDVTSYIPSSGAKFLLLEVDSAGAITVQSGTAVDIREELVMEDIPSPTLGTVPLVAVMVYAGQVKIWKTLSKQDVVDLRWSRYATGLDTSITAPLYAGRHVAAADPTVTDDDTAGFLQLHLWLNSTSGARFVCTDNSTGAAVWASLAGGGGGTWGSITGTLSAQTDLQTVLDAKVDENAAITGATKTKITYDAKGLVTAGADATAADVGADPAGSAATALLSAQSYADGVSSNASVIAKVLTGFSSGAGTVSSSDSILAAFQKVVGNIALKLTANAAITGATKTKITYDANGLVTAGADAKAYQTYNGNGLNGTIAAGATQYTPVGQWGLSAGNYGFVVNRAGTIKNLYQRINSTQPATGTLVVTVYVNGAASALVLTIAANSVTGVYSETATGVSVSAGNAIVVGIKNNASGASAFIGANSLDFEYSVV